jgi:hypothetical protein
MRHPSLRPHTFRSQAEHARHPEWLKQFTSRERHDLIGEDRQARAHVFTIMAGILATGVVLAAIVFGAVIAR